MRNLTLISLFIITIIFCCKKEQPDLVLPIVENTYERDTSAAPKIVKILFIGNSHTYVNDIPGLMHKLAKSANDSIISMMSAPGGYEFKGHCTLEATLSAIKSQKWDFVILQESGWKAALPEPMADTMVFPYAVKLNELIKANNKNTKVILYMTHGYEYGADWCNEDPNVCTYEGMQAEVKRNYLKMAQMTGAKIAPAGILWKIIRENNPGINLFASDHFHPGIKGSYISACAIYLTIFDKDIRGKYFPDGVTSEEADMIQNTVVSTIIKGNPNWRDY